MNNFILFLLLTFSIFFGKESLSQDTNSVELHLQVFEKGICVPMIKSPNYSTSKLRFSKSVFQSTTYYTTTHVYIDAKDSAELNPTVNHENQSSSVLLNPNLEYDIVILHTDGFFSNGQDSMVIHIDKLKRDAQVSFDFKEGKFDLIKFDSFKKLSSSDQPDFSNREEVSFKKTLKLDSISHYENGNVKEKFFLIYKAYPLYFVQEFDSLNPQKYAQGCRLSPQQVYQNYSQQSVWVDANNSNKYGYWEEYENGLLTSHSYWASTLYEKFEWYAPRQLKSRWKYVHQMNESLVYEVYHRNGKIKESYDKGTRTKRAALKFYSYSPDWELLMITTYDSTNGITKQKIQKREIFYKNGQLKMEENFLSTYSIKYFNEDGTERNM